MQTGGKPLAERTSRPAAAEPLVKPNGSLGRVDFEVWGDVANACSHFILPMRNASPLRMVNVTRVTGESILRQYTQDSATSSSGFVATDA